MIKETAKSSKSRKWIMINDTALIIKVHLGGMEVVRAAFIFKSSIDK